MANMNLGGTIRINRTGFFIIGVVCLFYILFYYLSSDDVSKTAAEQQNAVYDMNKLLLAAIAATKLGGEAIIRSESQVDGDIQFKLKGIKPNYFFIALENWHCFKSTSRIG